MAAGVIALPLLALFVVRLTTADEEPASTRPTPLTLSAEAAIRSADNLGQLALERTDNPDPLIGIQALAAFESLARHSAAPALRQHLIAEALGSYGSTSAASTEDETRRLSLLAALATVSGDHQSKIDVSAVDRHIAAAAADFDARLQTDVGQLSTVEAAVLAARLKTSSGNDLFRVACQKFQNSTVSQQTARQLATAHVIVALIGQECAGAAAALPKLAPFVRPAEIEGCYLFMPAASRTGGSAFVSACWDSIAASTSETSPAASVRVIFAASRLLAGLPADLRTGTVTRLSSALSNGTYFRGSLSPRINYDAFGRVLSGQLAQRLTPETVRPSAAQPVPSFAVPANDEYGRVIMSLGLPGARTSGSSIDFPAMPPAERVEIGALVARAADDCSKLPADWHRLADDYIANAAKKSQPSYLKSSALGAVINRRTACFSPVPVASANAIKRLTTATKTAVGRQVKTDESATTVNIYALATSLELLCAADSTSPVAVAAREQLLSHGDDYIAGVRDGSIPGAYSLANLYAAFRVREIVTTGCTGAWWQSR
ncbi:hypothetical protein [Paractinoplanes rishiriensis]|uniref:Uncharacterized protein n=1 Tax=Paractinoplanes rishiriensis TaxID=1050105 RepID=A0A919JVN3_9ACTN|nr:hypothetical protein [Actinoplanes rishiriensis]GIE96046.1 hypothetical protein Ari01nite_35110 [Actinoplanes rishiriensis]